MNRRTSSTIAPGAAPPPPEKDATTTFDSISPMSVSSFDADLDRVLEILRSLPMLRRYGGDTEALNEARDILEKVRAAL